jgi:hypothetical protein
MVRKRAVMSRSELRRFRRSVALVVTVLLVAVLGPGIPAQADDGSGRPGVQHAGKTVEGHQVKTRPREPDPATRKQAAPKAAWPKPGSAEVTLPAGQPETGNVRAVTAPVRADGLPVWIGAPTKAPESAVAQTSPRRVKVSVLDRRSAQRAGLTGRCSRSRVRTLGRPLVAWASS